MAAMEPVEINAGDYYLRQLRADPRLDDRPALLEAFGDETHRRWVPHIVLTTLDEAGEYVAWRATQWDRGERCSWAVAEPTTGDLAGEVGLKDLDFAEGSAEASVWVHPAFRGRGVAVTTLGAALRFGFGALDLRTVRYRHHRDNHVSTSVARRLGFRHAGPAEGDREDWVLDASP